MPKNKKFDDAQVCFMFFVFSTRVDECFFDALENAAAVGAAGKAPAGQG
jgi:hypothetical protein